MIRAPELYKPYVVVGIKHGTTMMKGGKELGIIRIIK